MISRSVEQQTPRPRQAEALACLQQSQDFFHAATSTSIIAAKPLALYYSLMNLVKVYCLTHGARPTFDQAQHGMTALLHPGGRELIGAFLRVFPSVPADDANNFDEFMQVLAGAGVPANTDYQLPILLPQIVPGHRFWAQGARRSERFIAVHDVQIWHDPAVHQMWLKLYFVADDLSRLGVTQQRLLQEARLGGAFRGVACNENFEGRDLIAFEQNVPHLYAGDHPADDFSNVIDSVRNRLWVVVTSVPVYRKYYVYLAPVTEHAFVLPQLSSIYALTFYLGSITRYRPHHYDVIAEGVFGPFVQEFVDGQPLQFLYLLASMFARQDVTRPSIL